MAATTHTIESAILEALGISLIHPGAYSSDPCGDREEIDFRRVVEISTPTAAVFGSDHELINGHITIRLRGLADILHEQGSYQADTARMTARLLRAAIVGTSAVTLWDIELSY